MGQTYQQSSKSQNAQTGSSESVLRRKNNFLSNSRNDGGNHMGDGVSGMNQYPANESAEGSSQNKY